MKPKHIDAIGSVVTGLLLTLLLGLGMVFGESLERLFPDSQTHRWWNFYVVDQWFGLGIMPVLFAAYTARRAKQRKLSCAVLMCSVPAMAAFICEYVINIITQIEWSRERGLTGPFGYTSPLDVWANLCLLVRRMSWAVIIGFIGARLAGVARGHEMTGAANNGTDAT